MKISAGRTDYTATEQEVCGLHLANKGEAIDSEYELIKAQFVATHRDFNRDDDFEFPDWHANIRMLWVYLYSDRFYAPELLVNIHSIIESTDFRWFAQFECYSPILENTDNRTGSIGSFFVYNNSAVFCDSVEWDQILPRIAG